jgi:pimeloyl-ACP methyl ester carboxylesterase
MVSSPYLLFNASSIHLIVLLDILLYYTPQFRERMVRAVSREMNRIYHLFLTRNPAFTGRVSLVGHSLGSAICFDILCRQPLSSNQPVPKEFNLDKRLELDFDVHGFFAVGSPVGLFQMLRGRNIAARGVLERKVMVNTPLGEEFRELVESGEVLVSCPKVSPVMRGS